MSAKETKEQMSRLIKQEHPRLLGYIRKRWNQEIEEPEDLLNDVVERIYRLPDIRVPLEQLGAYLYRSVRNRIIDMLRKKAGERVLSLDASTEDNKNGLIDLLEDFRFSPEQILEEDEMRILLNRSLLSLTEPERALVVENELHGVPFKVLAEEWDEPLGTLLSRKQRAMKKLKKFIDKEMNQ